MLGRPVESWETPQLDEDSAIRILRTLVRTRLASDRLDALHSSGELDYHPPSEPDALAAATVTEALGERGWLFCGNRHLAAFLHRGVSFEQYFDHVFANRSDVAHGHRMPGFFTARRQGIVAAATPTYGALTHAVGFAWAARERNEPVGVAALFGGAAVDSAEFHSALNFAGVMNAPIVFVAVCRSPRQPPVTDVSIAYGLPATCCDGSDPYATFRSVRRALDAGRPHLVEAWIEPEHDAESRFRAHLEAGGQWDEAQQTETESTIADTIDRAVAQASRRGEPEQSTLFRDVFSELPPWLEAQAEELRQTSKEP